MSFPAFLLMAKSFLSRLFQTNRSANATHLFHCHQHHPGGHAEDTHTHISEITTTNWSHECLTALESVSDWFNNLRFNTFMCVKSCALRPQIIHKPTHDLKQQLSNYSKRVAGSVTELIQAAEAMKGTVCVCVSCFSRSRASPVLSIWSGQVSTSSSASWAGNPSRIYQDNPCHPSLKVIWELGLIIPRPWFNTWWETGRISAVSERERGGLKEDL